MDQSDQLSQNKERIIGFCSYIGKQYCGFQRQIMDGVEVKTVQFDLEKILKIVLKEDIKVKSCSRTDAGVSAQNLGFQFYIEDQKISLDNLKKRLNFQYKANNMQISIENLYYPDQDLNIRASVLYKTYVYSIDSNLKDRIFNVFQRQKLVWSLEESIDLQKVQEVLDLYIGTHNFLGFTIKDQRYQYLSQYQKEIISCKLIQKKHENYDDVQSFYIEIKGKSFMTYQVRYMVGMAYFYQQGKCTLQNIIDQLNPEQLDFSKYNDKNRKKAPSWGLCLQDVVYPSTFLLKEKKQLDQIQLDQIQLDQKQLDQKQLEQI